MSNFPSSLRYRGRRKSSCSSSSSSDPTSPVSPPISLSMPTNFPMRMRDKGKGVQHSFSAVPSIHDGHEHGFDDVAVDTIEIESPTNSSQEILKARRESIYSRRNSMRRNSVNTNSPQLVVDTTESDRDSSMLDIPLAVAIIPPLGTLLIGGDFFKDFLLLLLMFFYLHQLIKLPWDLYLASRPRGRHLDPQMSNPDYNVPSHIRDVYNHVVSELKTAEFVYLTLSVLSPLIGAALLRYVCTALTGQDYISWFSTGLFVLVTGVRPWGHLTRRLKERTEDLQETLVGINEEYIATDDGGEKSILERIEELEDIVTMLREKVKSEVEGKNEMDESLNIVDVALDKVVRDVAHQFQTMSERVGRLESVVRMSSVNEKSFGDGEVRNLGKMVDRRFVEDDDFRPRNTGQGNSIPTKYEGSSKTRRRRMSKVRERAWSKTSLPPPSEDQTASTATRIFPTRRSYFNSILCSWFESIFRFEPRIPIEGTLDLVLYPFRFGRALLWGFVLFLKRNFV